MTVYIHCGTPREPDDREGAGRKRSGLDFHHARDMVVVAIGLSPNPLVPSLTKGIDTHPWGDVKLMTT